MLGRKMGVALVAAGVGAALGITGFAAGMGGSYPTAKSVQKRVVVVPASGKLTFAPLKLTVKPGKVRFTLRNTSTVGHDLTLEPQGGGSTLGKTPIIGKTTASFTVTLTKGKYSYSCKVPGHEAAGMKGTLTVR